ncbi:MAG: response regulator [Anaerolineales bacterium]|nr:response regulator [Anaerolineales bacterium]
MLNIFLADRHTEVRSALQLLIEQQPTWQICGQADNTLRLLAQLSQQCPQFLLLDAGLDGLPGVRRANSTEGLAELLTVIQGLCPHTRVIVLSTAPETRQVALDAGAKAYLSKNEPPEMLLDLLQQS